MRWWRSESIGEYESNKCFAKRRKTILTCVMWMRGEQGWKSEELMILHLMFGMEK